MIKNMELDRDKVAARTQAAELEVDRSVRRSRSSALGVTVLVHILIAILLGLAFVLPEPKPIVQIVAVTDKGIGEDNMKKKDFARSVQQKPQPAQSASKVQPIMSNIASAVSLPSFESEEEPEGIGADFGRGFGYGKGQGGGGGGGSISFFGVPQKAKSIVFCVDFSGSMEQEAAGGGTRLTRLKEELIRSVTKLPNGMPFQVLYYSGEPWLGNETFESAPTRDPNDPADRIPWSRATKDSIARVVSEIRSAKPPTAGATLWGPPLRQALAMSPSPAMIWLLSDGAAQDYEEVREDIQKINPNRVPINVIGFELVGPGYKALVDIARVTGGTYSIVVKGKLYGGAASLRFATDEFDVDPGFGF
jgi:hypothetical protein